MPEQGIIPRFIAEIRFNENTIYKEGIYIVAGLNQMSELKYNLIALPLEDSEERLFPQDNIPLDYLTQYNHYSPSLQMLTYLHTLSYLKK